jgi:hypothetical protein
MGQIIKWAKENGLSIVVFFAIVSLNCVFVYTINLANARSKKSRQIETACEETCEPNRFKMIDDTCACRTVDGDWDMKYDEDS